MADETETTPAAEKTETAPSTTKSNHLLETDKNSPDPDEVELQAALKEVEDEGKAPAGDETPAVETPKSEAAETPAAKTPATTDNNNVPVAALQDERNKRHEAEDLARKNASSALYWKGVADGKYPDPRRPKEETTEPTADETREAEIKSEMTDLAKQVDAGTLSVEEQEAKRQALDDELAGIREERILGKVKAVAPQAGNDLYLQTLTGKLEEADPWIKNVPENDIQNLIPFARDMLAKDGVDMTAINGTPIGDYRLREALIKTAKQFGFNERYAGETTPAAPKAPDSSVTRPTADHLKEKQELQAKAPGAPSGTTAPANTWTEERVSSMDSVDLETMPMSELKKLTENLDRQATATRTSTTTRR